MDTTYDESEKLDRNNVLWHMESLWISNITTDITEKRKPLVEPQSALQKRRIGPDTTN